MHKHLSEILTLPLLRSTPTETSPRGPTMHPASTPDQATGAPPATREWALRWFGAAMLSVYVALGVYLAIDADRWQQLVFLVLWVPLIAAFVAPMAALAAGVRWALCRRWPSRVWVSVVLGALAGPIVLFLIYVTGDPRTLVEPVRADLAAVFFPPLVLGGAAAGWLAERRMAPRRLAWWATALGASLLGLVLLDPISALFPRYGEGIPSWPPR